MAASNKNRIIIVNSSILERDLLKKAFEDVPDMDVLSVAPNGRLGLAYAQDKKPDIVILDMAIKDILPVQFCIRFQEKASHTGIILTTGSNPDLETIEQVIIALETGAFDFIKMPEFKSEKQGVEALRTKLISKVRGFSIKRYSHLAKIASGKAISGGIENRIDEAANIVVEGTGEKEKAKIPAFKSPGGPVKLIGLGVSTGGPEALTRILPLLPQNFPVPILLVIHMPVNFTATLANELNKKSKVNVVEGKKGQLVEKGVVYISEGGKHMILSKDEQGRLIVDYSDSAPENGCRPSVDVLFRSIAEQLGSQTAVILLTGMGEDGVKGMKLLKEKGAFTLAQDEESSVIWGMPGSAVKAGIVDDVVSLDYIHNRLLGLVK